MSKYLIEIPHGSEKIECLRSVSILLSSGSHFLTNADWGCMDGEHKAWFFMDANSKDEVQEFTKGRLELIKIGGATVGRETL